MKKTLIVIFAVFAAIMIFKPTPYDKALAWDTSDINNYVGVDNLYVDHLGDLIVDWHQVQPDYPVSSGMSDEEVVPMIFSTSTLSRDGVNTGGPSGGYFLNAPPALTGETHSAGGGCAVNGSNPYAGASMAPDGNQYSYSTVWDGNTGTQVSVASNVTSGTEVYLVFESIPTGCNGPGGVSYLSEVGYTPTVVAIPASSNIIAPTNNSNVGNFPAWGVNVLTNPTGGNVTGTIEVDYGSANSSSLPLVDSSTFGPIAAGAQQTITIGLSNNLVNALGATTTWWATPVLTIDGVRLPGNQIEFFTNINDPTTPGGSCDNPESVGLSSPLPNHTITNDFANWTISTPDLLEGCSYSLIIGYSPSSTQEMGVTGVQDQTTINVTPSYNPSTINILKSKDLWNYYAATTTEIDYFVQLINSNDGYTVGSNQGLFYLGYSATSSPLTAPPGFNSTQQCGGVCQGFGTIGGGSITTATSTIATTGAQCTPPSGPTDIGGGIAYGFCETINWLFVPNQSTDGILAGDMNALQNTPPFAWFFATNNIIQQNAMTNTNVTPDLGVSYTIETGISGATTSMTLLPADLTSNGFLADGRLVDDWYNLVLTVCVLIAIIMVYKIVL